MQCNRSSHSDKQRQPTIEQPTNANGIMMDDEGNQHDAIGYISTLFLMESVRVNDDDNSGDSDYGSSRINDIIDKEEEDGSNNNEPFQTQIRRGRQTLVAKNQWFRGPLREASTSFISLT